MAKGLAIPALRKLNRQPYVVSPIVFVISPLLCYIITAFFKGCPTVSSTFFAHTLYSTIFSAL
jgi:hypothetical protein